MRMIPGKTKIRFELIRGVRIPDMLVGIVFLALIILVITSNIPGAFYVALALLSVAVVLMVRVNEDPIYVFLLRIIRHIGYKRHYARTRDDEFLITKNDNSAFMDLAIGKVFSGSASAKENGQTKKQRKALKKEYAARKKQADQMLKDGSLSREEKERIAAEQEREYRKIAKEEGRKKEAALDRDEMEDIIPFTDIEDNVICYDDEYYGAVIEVSPVEFRFYSQYRRTMAIENGLGRVLRTLPMSYAANIVKIDRPIDYRPYLASDEEKLEDLRRSFEAGFMTEPEFRSRVEIMQDRLNMLRRLCAQEKVVSPAYYLVLFDQDKKQLDHHVKTAIETLSGTNLPVRRLGDRDLALFLKYTNDIDFDESDVDRIQPEDYAVWAMPATVDIKQRTVEVNRIITHNMMVTHYPTMVGDGWLASLMSLPSTKVVIKCRPMDRVKSVQSIDRTLQELRMQYTSTGVDSKRIGLANHIESLNLLLSMLQNENETLLETNVYVTAYDIGATRADPHIIQPPRSLRRSFTDQRETVRQYYQEEKLTLRAMYFNQMKTFIGSQVSGYDTMAKRGQTMPSNSLAACYPWIFASVSDVGGIPMGDFEGVPVFVDFFHRDNERVNSNMVIVGKTGSGKSYAAKSLLANLAADDSKIFVLDPENEYTELAENLHGKFINVGNAQQGRLNPFHIISALEDDEAESMGPSGSYAAHLQFLEEFFRQILPDCDKDALEYLNSMIDRMYANMGITAATDLSGLAPEDYPTFDNLYESILTAYQTANNDYVRNMLRTLTTYISKFADDGRNASIWNGPSTVTTSENFTVFNFQSLLANRNTMVANAQMLLVLKYIDNEIIKNRDYNEKYGLHRKIVVVIDEAHAFIDNKFPVALDFMYQLAKRIRKYNGMQIVITQNIKDFVGSEDITRKSSAIINACQYSMIFALAPNDMHDLCTLYEKAGGINEIEQDRISTAPRGHAFTIISPQSRSNISVKVPEATVRLFQEHNCGSWYYAGAAGGERWEEFIGDSRRIHSENLRRKQETEQQIREQGSRSYVAFSRITEEELAATVQYYQQLHGSVPAAAAEAAPTVQPVIQPVIQPQPYQSEELLAELFNRFSYDSMMQEIQRSVRAEFEANREAFAASPAVRAADLPKSTEQLRESDDDIVELPAEEEEPAVPALAVSQGAKTASDDDDDDTGYTLGSIFNAEAMAEAARLQKEEDSTSSERYEQSDDDDDDDDFSLASIFEDDSDEDVQENQIDLMPLYNKTVIDASLEELAKYNIAHDF